MVAFYLSVPSHELSLSTPSVDLGEVIEFARAHANRLEAVVYIYMEGARMGCPNRWAVSPKGYLSVEGVEMPRCAGCGV